ncbi:MAG TPA: 2-oxoisovalerate dehydrogenase E1 subunit beta [Halomicronema sp.]
MNEITFLIEESPEEGFNARAVGASIFTEAENIAELYDHIRDAVMCHFEEGKAPQTIRLQLLQ